MGTHGLLCFFVARGHGPAGADQGRDACGQGVRTEDHQILVEVAGLGDDDGTLDAQLDAAPAQAKRGAHSRLVVVAGHDEAGDARRRRECAEATGRECRCGG